MKTKTKKAKLLLVLSVLLVSMVGSVFVIARTALAATRSWDGGGSDNNFSTPENWSGDVIPTDGDAIIFDDTSLSAATTVNNDLSSVTFASVTFQGSNSSYFYTISGNAFTVTAGVSSSTSAEISANITISGSQTFSVSDSSGTLTLSGNLSGSGAIDKGGNGIVLLSGSNGSYSGAITVTAGVLVATTANALGGTGAGTIVASGGALYLSPPDGSIVAEPLTLAGTGSGTGYATLTAGSYGSTSTYRGLTISGGLTLQSNITYYANYANTTLTGACSGGFTININAGSAGTLTNNSSPNACQVTGGGTRTITYSGNEPSTDIIVTANTIAVVTGTYRNATVQAAGTLRGTGSLATTTVESGGVIAPGTSPGCLNTGNLVMHSGSTYEFEMGGATVCSQYDQINVTGTVTLNPGVGSGTGPNLSASLINGFIPKVGQVYTIVNNDGSEAVLNGSFANLPEGATFTVSGVVFQISYVGGDGNDVTLTVKSIPGTPSTGFGLLTQNPAVIFAVALIWTAAILLIAYRYTMAQRA